MTVKLTLNGRFPLRQFDDRIRNQTSPAPLTLKNAVDQSPEVFSNCLDSRGSVLEYFDCFGRGRFHVSFDGLREKLALVTIGAIKASRKQVHRPAQILHANPVKSVFPKRIDGAIKPFRRIKLLRWPHLTSPESHGLT